MSRFFLLQCKRTLAMLPRVLLGLAVVAAVMGLLLTTVLRQDDSQDKIAVAIVGTSDDPIMAMAMTALTDLDSSRFTMEILSLTEEEAKKAMQERTIAAYAVIPENFAYEASYGNFLPITLVTGGDSRGLVSIFKTELTKVITDMLAESRKGVFGLANALEGEGLDPYRPMNDLSFEYVELILLRDHLYAAETLGVGDSLGLREYLICGLTVLFLGLACLPFGVVLIRRDLALPRLLASRGIGALGQILAEFLAYFLCICLLGLVLWAALSQFGISLGAMLIAVFCLSAVSFLLYQLATELIGGTVLQFVLLTAMAFVSGCMYPAYFFPEKVQQLANFLPTGAARLCLSGSIRGASALLLPLIWGGIALALAVPVRKHRLLHEGR